MSEDHVKVDKAWLQKIIGGLIIAMIGGIGSAASFFWSWEKSQVTETQFQEKLAVYDHGTILPLSETTQPPREGVAKALQICQSTALLTQTDVAKVIRDSNNNREWITNEFEWLVRITAASSETTPNHRAQTGAKAVARYRLNLKEGQDPDDAARAALATNPYDLR